MGLDIVNFFENKTLLVTGAMGFLARGSRPRENTDFARLATKRVLELDPEDSGIHVLLANAYSKGKEWRDVNRVRRMMRERKVKKTPGHKLD